MANFYTHLAHNIIFNKDPSSVIDYFREYKLLADTCNCQSCQMPMERPPRSTRRTSSTSDGWGWRCSNNRCSKRRTFRTIRAGEVCSTKLIQTPAQLGGPGVVVQIDESLFNHKAKHNRGRRAKKEGELWVFGLADTSFKPAITYMELVPKRNKETLLPIIQRIVKPGSIVYSDQWRAYNKIQDELNLEHAVVMVVNHSLNFVDSETGGPCTDHRVLLGQSQVQTKRNERCVFRCFAIILR
ncbi:unnamed protein product [Mytilus coruscus]|uniref:ISXO2-like transposase domain-containing protein n=1 Tax=Mytilus coruscus TaxID=42192 RepID=A0A6J8EPW9_MYTCO|nr:unnamed protein product [Mytilus coruscus]